MGTRKHRQRHRNGPDSRKHHFVPAGYIGFFAEPRGRTAKLQVYDKELAKSWVTTLEHVAYETDLYRLDPGQPPHAIEEALAKAEGPMIGAIREVEANRLSVPTENQVNAIVSFVALQFVRGQDVRDTIEDATTQVAPLSLEIVTSKPEIYEAEMKKFLAARPDIKPESIPSLEDARKSWLNLDISLGSSGFVVQTMMRSQETAFGLLAGMQLGLLGDERGGTCYR
jgi:Protein of unknown function (DUF4238)